MWRTWTRLPAVPHMLRRTEVFDAPSDKALVPFVSVEATLSLISALGIDRCLIELADAIAEAFPDHAELGMTPESKPPGSAIRDACRSCIGGRLKVSGRDRGLGWTYSCAQYARPNNFRSPSGRESRRLTRHVATGHVLHPDAWGVKREPLGRQEAKGLCIHDEGLKTVRDQRHSPSGA